MTIDPSAASNVSGNPGNAAPGWSGSSWQAPGAGGKSEYYITPQSIFGYSITISQLASLSFWTNKPTDGTNPDWTLYIYTAKEGAGDSGSFYRSRLNSEPYLSGNTVSPNTWFNWTSDGSNSNPLRWYDSNRNGGVFGTFTDPTLATIQAGPINWPSASTWDYRTETVLFFSIQTGSAWANGFTGLVDGLQINLNNGDVGNVNLEAVPEPATCAMFSLALAAIAFRKMRR